MLKKSFYNIIVDELENGDVLLYNSLTNAFGIMYKEIKQIYESSEIIDENSLNDEVKKYIKMMKDNGFLVDFNLNEYEKLKILSRISRFNQNFLNLTIAPTLYCNMDCPYCYEKKSNSRMNEDVRNKLVDFVAGIIKKNRYKGITVTWYGGEPLLEKDIILDLSTNFINICKENNAEYYAGIITNGVLLNKDIAKDLREICHVRFTQITIDGLEETNNKRRRLKNGFNSFNIICNNIDECVDILDINIRVNIDKENQHDLPALIDYFNNRWGTKVRYNFAPVDKSTDYCNYELSKCFNNDEITQLNSELVNLMYEKGIKNFVQNYMPRIKFVPCSAVCTNSYVICPEGNIYTCWDVIGIEEYKIGSLKDGISINSEYLKWLSLEIPESCSECKLLPLCQAGCPYFRIRNSNKTKCYFGSLNIKDNLKIIYKTYKESTKGCEKYENVKISM
ncbi:radical SAM/SPASM domain-containing protein [Thermobrachium celere]|uniref:radical SAM/SPASM domain-containing protein n=1 Tax=Thermobrachium celere TaxID=53422 RepID=UPI00194505F3|nr:radical SAM protein [Thermobrachium celere]GFR34199.1 radical SAM/SPASM domain Clo7bot peptide maturase [Thermobrachium celere]